MRPCTPVPAPCPCRAHHPLAEPARAPRGCYGLGALRAPPTRGDHAVPPGAAVHAQSFFAQTEETTGASLPQFDKDELDAFLECGILAHGFLRLRCADCAHDKLLAFSCKRRGFRPSCRARRIAKHAANLVEHVIPRVPVRQWVQSLPFPTRVPLPAQPVLKAPPAWCPNVPPKHLHPIRKPSSEMTWLWLWRFVCF